jgi:hypothetical protein
MATYRAPESLARSRVLLTEDEAAHHEECGQGGSSYNGAEGLARFQLLAAGDAAGEYREQPPA